MNNMMDKMIKARSILLLDHPFFGILSFRLEMIETPWVPTAGVDGRHLYFNPNFVNDLSIQELVGVLAHEVLHCAAGHIWRGEGRDHEKFNIAGDYAINPSVIAAGMKLPKGALISDKYNNMSAEEIYNLLPDPPKQQGSGGQGKGNGNGNEQGQSNGNGNGNQNGNSLGNASDPGGCGSIMKPADGSSEKEMESEWKAAIVQAAQLAKGDVPQNMKRMIDELINPVIPWHILLRDFIELTAKNDYNWNRPNRRYLQSGIILPSLISEELPDVVIGIDTSGSISDSDLNLFASETSSILGAYDTTIHAMYCDAEVHKVEEFKRADMPLKLKMCGGGGTDFRPVFKKIDDEGIMPSCVIYFTDLQGDFPSVEPDYPVIWVSTYDNAKAPFGKTVYFNNK